MRKVFNSMLFTGMWCFSLPPNRTIHHITVRNFLHGAATGIRRKLCWYRQQNCKKNQREGSSTTLLQRWIRVRCSFTTSKGGYNVKNEICDWMARKLMLNWTNEKVYKLEWLILCLFRPSGASGTWYREEEMDVRWIWPWSSLALICWRSNRRRKNEGKMGTAWIEMKEKFKSNRGARQNVLELETSTACGRIETDLKHNKFEMTVAV